MSIIQGSDAVVAFYVKLAPIDSDAFTSALKLQGWDGWVGGLTLLLSVTVNEFLNQGLWQRYVSARSHKDAIVGLGMGGLLSAVTVGNVVLGDAGNSLWFRRNRSTGRRQHTGCSGWRA